MNNGYISGKVDVVRCGVNLNDLIVKIFDYDTNEYLGSYPLSNGGGYIIHDLDTTKHYNIILEDLTRTIEQQVLSYRITATPPYELYVKFTPGSTNRLDLTWKLDGAIEEQRYFRSDSPIDPNNLPPPKAVFTGDIKNYVDSDIDVEKQYHVYISSFRNTFDVLSNEFIVQTTNIKKYRFVRIFITENNGSSYTALQEIEITNQINGIDVTNPNTITNQSSYFAISNANANKLVDNNFTDYQMSAWISKSGELPPPHWVSFDLGGEQELVELRMWPQNYQDGVLRAPKNFIVQGSNDNVIWNDIKEFKDITNWNAGDSKTFNLMVLPPPYSLQGTWNNTTESIDLTWEFDEWTVTYNIYRRESNDINPPVAIAIATGLTSMSYSDNTAEFGKTYLYSIGAVKNGFEKVGSEIAVVASFQPSELLIFADASTFPSSVIVDSSLSARPITNVGARIVQNTFGYNVFDSGLLYFDGSSHINTSVSQLLTSDFTLEFKIKASRNSGSFERVICFGSTNNSPAGGFYIQQNNNATLSIYGLTGTLVVPVQVLNNSMQHVCIMRKNGIYYAFIEGVQVAVNNTSTSHSITQTNLRIGGFETANGQKFNGYLASIRLSKFARYNENGYTPPSSKFPPV